MFSYSSHVQNKIIPGIIGKELPEEVTARTKNNFVGLNLKSVLTEKGHISQGFVHKKVPKCLDKLSVMSIWGQGHLTIHDDWRLNFRLVLVSIITKY